jgi:methylated-DNA-[protein]-cysteine S-methyltransferase
MGPSGDAHAQADGYSLFDTAIGRCAIAWNEHGIVGVQLPEADEQRTRRRAQRRWPDACASAPTEHVRSIIDSIVALLRGEPVDLTAVPLDVTGVAEFNRRVYDVTRSIPAGATLTYGDIAKRVGEPGAARAVGQALGANPFAIIVPCHRVIAAHGKMGGFSAGGGVSTKQRMLAIEGASVTIAPTLFD